ncbi:MAG: 1-acyl-sn-glycerol-3-phosphate acyltransferase [Saprospiraceae bacterium]|nr:1-acyl-sn-glycerol-3-phosphate acyltransferase [Saprospiraceae bacterium]
MYLIPYILRAKLRQGLFYQILRQLVATLLKTYFRKIYVIGRDNIPLDKPVILASNHPMAFCDACILACFTERPLHFLVRGDVFKSRWKWFFKMTNQIPIYRFRDGFSNMRKNQQSFELTYEVLAEKKVLLIFSEGNTRLQKKLFPLQKGTARLAFGAWESQALDETVIVPVGINYSDGTSFRSDVQISIGKELEIKTYLAAYRTDAVSAMQNFTKELGKHLASHVIHLEGPKRTELFNQVTQNDTLPQDQAYWPIVDFDHKRFDAEMKLSQALNTADDSQIKKILLEWRQSFDGNQKQPKSPLKVVQFMILFLTGPIALGGYILNAIPFYLAKYVATEKVEKVEFQTPVRLGLLLIFYLLYSLLVVVISWQFLDGYALLLITILPLTGYSTIVWWEWKRGLRIDKDAAKSALRIEQLLSGT